MSAGLDALFKPKSVAIIGVSQNLMKPGGRALRYLLEQEYAGTIYLVNPKYTEISGIKCYPAIGDLPKGIDVAVISVPAKSTVGTVEQCIEQGIKSAVIFTSGFKEIGEEGQILQNKLTRLARSGPIRILGPNCLGLMNFAEKTPLTFGSFMEDLTQQSGKITFVTQSGALGSYVMAMGREMGIGFSCWVSTGNEADVQFNDCLHYFAADDHTKVIAGYVEDVRDAEKFLTGVDQCLRNQKPLVILKSGTTEIGAKAASSHTGAMAGAAEVYEAVFEQKGIIRAHDLYEMLDFSNILSNAPQMKEISAAVVSVSGGAGILLADKCYELGIKMADFLPETAEKLKKTLPEYGSSHNPIDVTANIVSDAKVFEGCLDICLADKNVNTLIVFLGSLEQMSDQIVRALINTAGNHPDKLLVVTWVATPANAAKQLQQANIMVYPEPVRCVKSIAALQKYWSGQERLSAGGAREAAEHSQLKSKQLNLIKSKQGKYLSEWESRQVLQDYNIPLAEGYIAGSSEELVKLGEKIGYPLVLKVDSPDIIHKTELGAVKVNIRNAQELIDSYNEMYQRIKQARPQAKINGFWVQEMVTGGTEVILGMKQDQTFGPVIAFGLGGIFVELFKDVVLRVAPLTPPDVDVMVQGIKGARLLSGFRRMPATDIDSVKSILVSLSNLSMDLQGYIQEIDINPLMVLDEGLGSKAVDALIVLK